ncbi:hypothetical protein BOSEA1005_30447 [Hyphomicrobiales bacterium]|nr:hypothetical protein BOSEA1005_30447 [Hyphomicrobiales bacterium]CAI0346778.1 hypothetical protein BO1005MUT1_520290 [Hyphomicrobiales bacterium]
MTIPADLEGLFFGATWDFALDARPEMHLGIIHGVHQFYRFR